MLFQSDLEEIRYINFKKLKPIKLNLKYNLKNK